MSDGGKGSAPRKQQDQRAYEDGWSRIFGGKREKNQASEADSAKTETHPTPTAG